MTLVIDHINKSYGNHQVLTDLTMQLNEGEIYGFVGPNGAGKSTTMRIALGVLAHDSGEVRFRDAPIDDTTRRRIGYMPEERGLYGKEKIASQLQFFATLHGLDKQAARSATDELLERLDLTDRADDALDDLSLGNQQRVQLAASLVHDPELLILDEPFSGLDPTAVHIMSELLLERAEQGVPVLFSSHQLDLVQRLCHRVGVISRGHMVAEGTVDELRHSGPIFYRVHTTARDWYPAGTRVHSIDGDVITLEADSTQIDQDILHAALKQAPVHSFGRQVPDLTELFRDIAQER